jgi:hypothetical protein
MILIGIADAIFYMEQGRPIPIKIVAEGIDHLHQFSALTAFVEEIMEFSVKLDELIIVSSL